MTPLHDVLIVGGGIAGLAAAYELRVRGIRFQLLERATRVGGVILTEEVDGFTIDAGPDSLLVQKPAAIALCRDLGLDERLFPTNTPRTAYVLRGGVLHPLPEASILGIPTTLWPLAQTGLFTLTGKARMAAELAVPRRRDPSDESIGAFMRRRFGAEAVAYLAEPLLAGIHAGDVERLSMRALFPALVDAERRYGSVIRAFRTMRPAGSGEGAFRSLPGGIGELVAAIVRALPVGSVRTATATATVERDHLTDSFRVRTEAGDVITARSVIVATPAWVAADQIAAIDAELAALCRSIRYTSTATVVLSYLRSSVHHPLGGSGFVAPRVERTPLMAASWVSSKWPHRAPPGQVLLRAFLGGAYDPDALARGDDELIETAERELSGILGITGLRGMAMVYRWPRASAQHEVGHVDRMAAIDRRLARWPGLYLTGSGFRGVGIPDCVADARATAAAAAQHLARESLLRGQDRGGL